MRDFQGVEVTRPLALPQKENHKLKSKSKRNKETPQKMGRERRVHKGWGVEEHNANN